MTRQTLYALILALSALLFVGNAHARKEPMYVPGRELLTDTTGRSLGIDGVRQAIIAGATARGWRVTADEPGRLTLRIDPRSHTAILTADYDTQGYLLTYVSSDRLNYKRKGQRTYIHPNYNRWVRNLIHDIAMAAQMRPAP